MKKVLLILSIVTVCMFASALFNASSSSAISISKARKQCSSASKARKHMKKITFKVWDLKGNKKVTRTKSIYVHKSMAKKFKKAFDLIYKGKEKFPISVVGGYQWRGSTKSLHSLGLAVDINPDQNYMIDGKRVLAGSCWKPGKNPYSIKKNGDVIKAFKKVGLKQCIWGSRRDYMHFSVRGY